MDLTTTAEHQKCMINAEEGGGGAGTPAGDAARPAPWWRRVTAYGGFLAGTGLVALHVADDNFLQPADGMRAADHLVAGLVPLGLLGLAAWGYPRVRAGAQAVLALLVGLFGLTVAAEAVYYTRTIGASGDDFTGWAAVPAGLLLVGLGAATLWRSRRRDGGPARRWSRRGLRLVAAVVFGYLIVQPVAFAYVITHTARAAVPADELGVPHEDVTFTTSDGLELEGWYIPSKNGAAIVDFPGRLGTQAHARMLARHGYGVLLFDRRGEGRSDGDGNMLGWGGDRDIHAAVEYLKGRPDVDPERIGGIGFSVGGELMLEAAAKNDDLAAVVSEGAGTRQIREAQQDYPASTFWPLLPGFAARDLAVSVFSNTTAPDRLTELVPDIAPRPVFLIWAPNGGNVETMNPEFQRVGGPNVSIWSIPDAKHIKGITAQPATYERRVIGFLDDALLD